MPEFDTADVRRYYDRHTRDFVAHGQGGAVGALHRAVWAPGVDSLEAAFHHVEDRIASQIPAAEDGASPPRILDLGCGVGGSLCYIAGRREIIGTGITLSPVQVAHAGRRIAEAGLTERVRCVEGDYATPPGDLTPVDLAYAIESFVHAPDPAAFFATCGRLIRPGGLLVICDDFRREAATPEATATVERFRRGWHLNTLLDPRELRSLAAQSGFEHQRTEDLTPQLRLGRPRDRLIALFVRLTGWLPLDGTRFGHLVGGDALHTCLSRGWIGYDLALFRRRA